MLIKLKLLCYMLYKNLHFHILTTNLTNKSKESASQYLLSESEVMATSGVHTTAMNHDLCSVMAFNWR